MMSPMISCVGGILQKFHLGMPNSALFSRTIHFTSTLHHNRESHNLHRCYQILNVSEDSDLGVVRESYLTLAKQYHPDSGSKIADTEQFVLIENAYTTILKHQQQKEENIRREEINDETEFDIKHIAPQHRQYLEFEGFGFGPPSQRQRQYGQVRMARATENVSEYRTTKLSASYENRLAIQDRRRARIMKLSNAIDRLVEDMILESMSKGEFDNLPGKGKPLIPSIHNPMIDSTTHNLNRVLIENGYAPEWVMLQKDISRGLQDGKRQLFAARVKAGPEPIPSQKKYFWDKNLLLFRETMDTINKDIQRFNMMVPSFYQQVIPYDINREINKILEDYKEKLEKGQINQEPVEDTKLYYTPINPNDKIRLKDVLREIKALFTSS